MSLATDIVKATLNFARLNRFMNGPASEAVETDGGPIPTLRKVIADASVTVTNAFAATSTSAVALSAGTKTFETQAGKGFKPGQFVIASNGTSYVSGVVVSYVNTTLIINSARFNGTGTPAVWNIALSGVPGATGADGLGGGGGGVSEVLVTKFPWEN